MLLTCFYTLLLVGITNSYKILIVVPVGTNSHFTLGSALAKGLLKAGHDVTMVGHFKVKNSPKDRGKLNEILLGGFEAEGKRDRAINQNHFDFEKMSPFVQRPLMSWLGLKMTNGTLHNPGIQKLLQSNEQYDAVIIEQFINDGLKILAHHFKAPLILFSTVSANRWFNGLVGNPEPPSYIPDLFTSYSVPMTFCNRVKNLLVGVTSDLLEHFYFYPGHNRLVKEVYKNAPELDSLLYNVSLVLVNSHESTSQAVPNVPNMVNIGGFHLEPAKPLPNDLQEYMDSAKDGVIYFSMGSTITPSMMPKTILEILIKVLGKLKQKVLWKWDEEKLPNKPDNVKISKWFPQQDILAHPNCRLFITHGGLLSTTETVYNGVPILAFPVFGDQKLNAAQAQSFGYGISLPISEITEEALRTALKDLLDTPKYRENAKRRAAIMQDRIVKPLDTAVYWVEYVIRHKGAPHLRVAAVDLPLYQYLLVDVIGFLILVIVVLFLVLYVGVKKICSKCKTKTDEKLKKNL